VVLHLSQELNKQEEHQPRGPQQKVLRLLGVDKTQCNRFYK
jgi:hypothetical protein